MNEGVSKMKFDLTEDAIALVEERASEAGVDFNTMMREMIIDAMVENCVQFGFEEEKKDEFRKLLQETVSVDIVDNPVLEKEVEPENKPE